MPWKTPDFEEINLSGEVTAYVNTDVAVRSSENSAARPEPPAVAGDQRDAVSACER